MISAAGLVLTACAGAPPLSRAPAPETPERFTAETGADLAGRTPSADWVAEFDDPALQLLVAEALENNPDIASIRAALDAASASARLSNAPRLPTLDATLGGSRRDSDPQGGVNSVSLGAVAGWEADIWARLSDQARAGALGREAAEADLAGARL